MVGLVTEVMRKNRPPGYAESQSYNQPPPQPAKTPHVTRRSTARAAPADPTTSSTAVQPSQPPKEVPRVSAADLEKIKAGLPYGIPVPGRKGMVTSPYAPEDGKYIDVTDFSSGSIVKDPYTGKFFLVP